MDVNNIRELIELMKANDLNEIKIQDGDTKIFLRRGGDDKAQPAHIMSIPNMAGHQMHVQAPPIQTQGPVAADAKALDADAELAKIASPMVGTFYSSPSPNAEAFVKVGDNVDTDTVVCIVEAMKVMNEVKSEIKGKIKKVLVEDGQSVEFGQAIFLIEEG